MIARSDLDSPPMCAPIPIRFAAVSAPDRGLIAMRLAALCGAIEPPILYPEAWNRVAVRYRGGSKARRLRRRV